MVALYKAIDYDGLECLNNSTVGCAASVAGFTTSISWIASYLSFAANACGQAVNSGALCAGDFTALMANFGEIATVGAAVQADCKLEKDAATILTKESPASSRNWLRFLPDRLPAARAQTQPALLPPPVPSRSSCPPQGFQSVARRDRKCKLCYITRPVSGLCDSHCLVSMSPVLRHKL